MPAKSEQQADFFGAVVGRIKDGVAEDPDDEVGKTARDFIDRYGKEKALEKAKDYTKVEESTDPVDAFLNEKASEEYCKNTDPDDMGFTQRASCKAQGYIERSDGTKRKSDKYKNEQRLREIIREMIRETVFDRKLKDIEGSDKKIKVYDSNSSKITFFEDEDGEIYMRIINKINGNVSDKIYVDINDLSKIIDHVNVLT